MDQDNTNLSQSSTTFLSHDEASEWLHAYAHAILMGGSPETLYPTVAVHLGQCAACSEDLDELLEVTRITIGGEDEVATECPRPDLSRLPRPWRTAPARTRPWFSDQLGRLWLVFSEELLQSWKPSALLGAARGSLLYAYPAEAAQIDSGMDPAAATPALGIEVVAESDPQTVLVVVNVDVPDRDALDQPGVSIALHTGNTVRRQATDGSGSASFPHIPKALLPHIVLEITVDRST